MQRRVVQGSRVPGVLERGARRAAVLGAAGVALVGLAGVSGLLCFFGAERVELLLEGGRGVEVDWAEGEVGGGGARFVGRAEAVCALEGGPSVEGEEEVGGAGGDDAWDGAGGVSEGCRSRSVLRRTECEVDPARLELPEGVDELGGVVAEPGRDERRNTATGHGRESPVSGVCEIAADLVVERGLWATAAHDGLCAGEREDAWWTGRDAPLR